MPNTKRDRTPVVAWASVAIIALVVAAVLGLTYDRDVDPIVILTLLLGLCSPTILALVALAKAHDNTMELQANTEATQETAAVVHGLANGDLEAKIQTAIARVMVSEDAADLLEREPGLVDELRRRAAGGDGP